MKKIVKVLLFFVVVFAPSVNAYTTKGYGSIKKIEIVEDKENQKCGNALCMAIAKVEYENKTVSYFLPRQNANGVLPNSGRTLAFTSMLNATTNKNLTPKEIEDYLVSQGGDGQLLSSNINSLMEYYGVDGYAYDSNLSKEAVAGIIKDSSTSGYPLSALISQTRCVDVPSVNHGILILGLDNDGYVSFVDSLGYYKIAKKRTPEELAECLTGDTAADKWGYRLLVMSFVDGQATSSSTIDDTGVNNPKNPNDLSTSTNTNPSGGSTTDLYHNFPSLTAKNEYTCENVFYIKEADGSLTEKEIKKILDNTFDILKILGVVISIVLSTTDYIKAVSKIDETKKTNIKLVKRILVAVLLMFLPFLLDAIFDFYGLFDISRCNIG